MVGPVATCARSAGGSEPPRGPTQLNADCQSAAPVKRNTRKTSRGLALEKAIEKNSGKPLSVEFDTETWKSFCANAEKFNNEIGQQVRDLIPLTYTTWKSVPPSTRARLVNKVREKFVFDIGKEEIIQGIDREASDRFRQWRYKLRNVFKDEGGEKDSDAPKTKVPKGVKTMEEWEKLCDYWGSEKQKKRSKINAENRLKKEYQSLQGTSSFSSQRYKKRDPTTNELPSLIDQFQDMHHRFPTGWTKEVAHAKHVEMVHLKESQSQYQSAASSSSSASMDSTQPILTERQIMEHVLGYRAGHAKGIGPLLKGTSKKQRESSSFTSATSSSRPPQDPMVERWIAQQMTFNQQQANYSRVLFEILRSALPHIDIPPPPTPPPGFDEPTPPPEPRMEDNGD